MTNKIDFPEYLEFGTNNIGEYTVTIGQDDIDQSPRDWDNLGTLTCFHSRYDLGDEHSYNDAEALFEELSGLDSDQLARLDEQLGQGSESYREKLGDLAYARYIILPLYLYDHSGLALNTTGFSCRWDSGQIGYIYVSLVDVRKEYSAKRISKKLRARVEKYLTGEVETYHKFISGQVYYAKIEGPDGEVVESCGGFYDDHEFTHTLSGFVKPVIEHHADQEHKAHQDQVKVWIKNRVPLQARAAVGGPHA